MKSLLQIKALSAKGDFVRVAEITGSSESNVKKVIAGLRPDNYNIQRVFSDLLEARERLAQREAKRRSRKNKRLVYE